MPKHTPEEADVMCLLDKFRQLEIRIDNVEKSQQYISDSHDVTNTKVNVLETDLFKTKNDTDTAIHLAKEAHTLINGIKPNYANITKSNNKNMFSGRRNSYNNNNNNNYNNYNNGSNNMRRGSSNPSQRGSSLGMPGTAGSYGQATKPTTRLGAPPRSRYLVITRVLKEKTEEDIKCYINEMDSNIEIRSLESISHEDAPFQKFKLEVSVSDFYKVKERDFWESAGISCYPFRGQWFRDTT